MVKRRSPARNSVNWLRARKRASGKGGSTRLEMTRCSGGGRDRKSTRLNSSHANISYAVFCLKKKRLHLFSCRLGPYHNITQGTGPPLPLPLLCLASAEAARRLCFDTQPPAPLVINASPTVPL